MKKSSEVNIDLITQSEDGKHMAPVLYFPISQAEQTFRNIYGPLSLDPGSLGLQNIDFFFPGVIFLLLFLLLFIYLSSAALGLCCCNQLSLVVESGVYSADVVHRLLIVMASLVAEDKLQGMQASVATAQGFSSGGSQTQLAYGLWDLPGPGIEPVSLPLHGGFLTTGSPAKPSNIILVSSEIIQSNDTPIFLII